jgi:hypothetical protein
MLDLDSLAEQRARSLNQQERDWKDAVWSPSFQSLSQRMSDGEVETFLSRFNSVKGFESAVSEIEKTGQSPTDWLKAGDTGANR